MPLFFFVIGFLLIDAGVRGNAKDVASQLATDVSGFLAFGAAIIILGVLGMSQTARPVAKSLLILVFVVFLVKNGNAVINGITAAAKATTAPSTDSTASTTSTVPTGQAAGSTDYSGEINTLSSIIGAYGALA